MADEDLIARLRATGQGQFSRAMRAAARDVENVGDEAHGASGGILAMGASAKRASRGVQGLTDDLGSSVGKMVASRLVLSGITGGALALAGVLSLPLVSSLGAAAAGFGVLGAAAGGAAAVGLGGFAIVAQSAFGMISKVRTAQQAYTLAVAQYGRDSDQAAKAQAKLNATLKVGGEPLRALVGELDKLSGRFGRLTQVARGAVLETFLKGVRAANGLLPTFARETNRSAGAIRDGIGAALLTLSGGEMRQTIRDLSRGFREAFGPAVTGGANLLIVFLRYVRAAAPAIGDVARGFYDWAKGLRVATGDTGRVQGQVQTLLGHLRSWARIGLGIVKIMLGIGRALAPQGGGWASTIGDVVNRFGDFLNSAQGISAVRGIFGTLTGAIGLMRTGISFLVGVAKQAGGQLLEAFRPALPFFQNILLPLLIGIGKGVLASVVGAFKVLVPIIRIIAVGLGWLGTQAAPLRGVFEKIGMVIGFVFSGAILRVIGLLPKVGILFRLLAIPVRVLGRVVGVTAGFLGRVFAPALRAVGRVFQTVTGVITAGVRLWLGAHRRVLGLIVSGMRALGGKLTGAARSAWNAVTRFFRGLGGAAFAIGKGIVEAIARGIAGAPGVLMDAVRGLADKLPGPLRSAAGAALGLIDGKAAGGPVGRTGPYVVGERGPEVVNMRAGDRVTPNAALGRAPQLPAGGRALIEIRVVSELSGREVGRGLTRVAADDLARMGAR